MDKLPFLCNTGGVWGGGGGRN